MTPIMFIYKCVHKAYYIMLHAYHNVATWIKFKVNDVKFSSFSTHGIPSVCVSKKGGMICIGNFFSMNNNYSANIIGYKVPCAMRCDKGNIIIGDNVGMSQTTLIAYGANITIGDYTILGGGVKVYTTDFHSIDYKLRREPGVVDQSGKRHADVVIGQDCFIGAGSIILKGVSIGDCSIIGAGSVVSKSIPSGEVWAGNPARFVKKI